MDDYFVTFLMFRPAGDSRWVPLRKVEWHTSVVAVNGPNAWALEGQPTQTAGAFARTTEVPVWDVVHKNGDAFIGDP